jgi:AraC-like DNA-binding protein
MSVRWRGWVTVRPGALMYGGSLGTARLHSHHAVQLLVASGGELTLGDDSGTERTCRAAVIPAHVRHAIVRGARDCLLVLLDPDTAAARALEGGDGSAASWVRDWDAEPGRWSDPAAAEQLIADATGYGEAPGPQHPGLKRALELIPRLLPDRVRMDAVAREVYLSESRLRHLFSEELGIPFRPYVLWVRLHRAVQLIGTGRSFTDAAHESGFSDAAHMTRVFRRMLGVAPSEVARNVRYLE